jgi:hypothetical protein
MWPWAAPPAHSTRSTRSAQVQTQEVRGGALTMGTGVGQRTSSTSTNNTTSSGRTIVGSISSTKPLNPPSPPPRASRSRDDDPRRSDESLPEYIQVHPPPKAVLHGPDHGRISEWCAKAAAKIEGHPVTRVKSWEAGDPEKHPDPFTA